MLFNQMVVAPAPACCGHEIANASGSVSVPDFFQTGDPVRERLCVEIKRRSGPLAGNFKPSIKIALAEEIAPRVDTDEGGSERETSED
jgi:hypothetical protein